MLLQKNPHDSYLFRYILFILVRVFRNDYFIQLNICGSVLVTPIDRGYDHHLKGELFTEISSCCSANQLGFFCKLDLSDLLLNRKYLF